MKVLVVGSGAREHALLWKLAQSPSVEALFVTPGNAGMAALATVLEPEDGLDSHDRYADLAEQHGVDLTVIGPESLLVEGLADHLVARGLRVFGPTREAARLEGSKIWAKEVMQRVGIPTASWRAYDDASSAMARAAELDWRCVIKADGLAAGKGSFVCGDRGDAEAALAAVFSGKGRTGSAVIVEEFLEGQEVSVFAITDGRTVVPFGSAQDHKRALNRDEGPNTGGMGAYSPVEHMHVAQDFARSFFEPIVRSLAANGIAYTGVLYAGAIVTADGPKILEFNCRFGDPEAEVLMCRLDSDLAELLWAAAEGTLHTIPAPVWSAQDALCVVLAAGTYPVSPDIGSPIVGVDDAERVPGVVVFHAGTDRDQGTGALLTHGGRILSVTGTGTGLEQARARAYEAVGKIRFPGMHFRDDIATKAPGVLFEAFTSEWRKPPQWEAQKRLASREISEIARDLGRLKSGARRSAVESAVLQDLAERLFAVAQIQLQPAAARSGTGTAWLAGAPPDRLTALRADLDAMSEQMQSPQAQAAVDALFSGPPAAPRRPPRRKRA